MVRSTYSERATPADALADRLETRTRAPSAETFAAAVELFVARMP